MNNQNAIESEKRLWSEFISGDANAFRLIYEEYIQILYKFGFHFSHNEELIKDSIQDLFIDLDRYRKNLNATDNIKSYLLVSFKRVLLRKIRQEDKIKALDVNEFKFAYSLANSNNDFESDINEQRLKMLETAMKELSNRQREAIYLKYVVGLNYDELPGVLQLNYQVTRNLVHRAIEKLRVSIQSMDIILYFLFGKSRY